jgi:GNAT superfamily N-acetyltransferase
MINLYGNHMIMNLVQNEQSWGILSQLPTNISEYDRKTYPDTDFIILIDSTSDVDKIRLLDDIPNGNFVVKTYDNQIKLHLESHFNAKKTTSFISFTTNTCPAIPMKFDVEESFDLNENVISFFHNNGYETTELNRFFDNNAKWFGIRSGNELVSGCFVFCNFENVWELGGVFTLPEYRRRGYAKTVVSTALKYLLSNNLIPRYLVKWDNIKSIRLAKSFGFQMFLNLDHYILEKKK